MSESSQAGRRRHEYLPNRMFDPVANPFAVQNLLVREEQSFALTPDGRPEFGFETDQIIHKEGPGAFALDDVIELADLSGARSFETEPDEDPAFVADATAAAAEASSEHADFMADASMSAQAETHFAEHAETDQSADTVAADHSTELSALAENSAEADQPNTTEAVASADADAAAALTASAASEEMLAAVAEPLDSPDPAVTPEASAEPDTVPAPQAVAEPEPASPVIETRASAPATPDLSSEAVTALVDAAREQARAETRELAYNEGLAAGKAQALAELKQAHDAQLSQLKTLHEALKKLSFDADALFEPVKKLTVHLAEQLVRGELAQSPQTISRLVDNSLRELNASGEKAVIVHLNPEDLEAYRPLVAQFGDSLILRPDALLDRGSVRVSLDGSVVEDLMQRRIDGLKKSLNQPAAPSWQSGGARLADRLGDAQRGSQHVEDVTAVETTGDDDAIDD